MRRRPFRKAMRNLLRIPGDFGHSFQFYSDSIPIQSGHRFDSIRTVFRADIGQFLGAIGMVSDRKWITVRIAPECRPV